jgi:hypothetical protein
MAVLDKALKQKVRGALAGISAPCCPQNRVPGEQGVALRMVRDRNRQDRIQLKPVTSWQADDCGRCLFQAFNGALGHGSGKALPVRLHRCNDARAWTDVRRGSDAELFLVLAGKPIWHPAATAPGIAGFGITELNGA